MAAIEENPWGEVDVDLVDTPPDDAWVQPEPNDPAPELTIGGPLVPTNGSAATALAYTLGADLGPVSLDLREPDITYVDWANIGRAIDFVGNAWQWWVGDWLRHGETLFGQESANVVEPSRKERYNLATRIANRDPGTLANWTSICSRVAKDVRRPELEFSHHAVVSPLEREAQIYWLNRAVEEGFSVAALRDAIRETRAPGEPEPEPAPDPGPSKPRSFDGSPGERRDEVLDLIYKSSESTPIGEWVYSDEVHHQLAAVLGYER